MKCDVIDGNEVNGLRQPILLSFVLEKLRGFKKICEPETLHCKKINIFVLKIITFYSEDDISEEVDFNQELLTFTLQMIKIWNFKQAFKISKVILFVSVVDIDLQQQNFMVT